MSRDVDVEKSLCCVSNYCLLARLMPRQRTTLPLNDTPVVNLLSGNDKKLYVCLSREDKSTSHCSNVLLHLFHSRLIGGLVVVGAVLISAIPIDVVMQLTDFSVLSILRAKLLPFSDTYARDCINKQIVNLNRTCNTRTGAD